MGSSAVLQGGMSERLHSGSALDDTIFGPDRAGLGLERSENADLSAGVDE